MVLNLGFSVACSRKSYQHQKLTRITCWSALILESLRWTVHSVLRADAIWSFWYTIFLPHVSVYWILWLLHFGWLLILSLYLDDDLPMFKCVSFCLHGCCGEWEGWSLKPNNKTNWMAVDTLILPFSFGFVRGIRSPVIGLSPMSSLFS